MDNALITPYKQKLFLDSLKKMKEKPKLKESMFRTKYLPIMLFTTESEKNMLAWITEVAGNPYLEVDVYKDGEPDNILFTVPPVLDNSADISVADVIPPVDRATKSYKEYASINPRAADAILKDGLDNQINVIKKSNVERYAEQWKSILSYYNIPVKDSSVAEKQKKVEDLFDDNENEF